MCHRKICDVHVRLCVCVCGWGGVPTILSHSQHKAVHDFGSWPHFPRVHDWQPWQHKAAHDFQSWAQWRCKRADAPALALTELQVDLGRLKRLVIKSVFGSNHGIPSSGCLPEGRPFLVTAVYGARPSSAGFRSSRMQKQIR